MKLEDHAGFRLLSAAERKSVLKTQSNGVDMVAFELACCARDRTGRAPRDAERLFRWALELDPGTQLAVTKFSALLLENDRLADARAVVDAGTAAAPHEAFNWFARAQIAEAQEKWNDVVEACEQVTRLSPRFTAAHGLCARGLARVRRFGDAVKAARKVLALDDAPQTAHYNLACYLCLGGETAEALKHLRAAIAIADRYRGLAAEDTDFRALAKNAEFAELLDPQSKQVARTREVQAKRNRRAAKAASESEAAYSRAREAMIAADLRALREVLSSAPALVRARDREGCTLLHWAVEASPAAVRLVLEAGADASARSRQVSAWEDALTPLHLACRRRSVSSAKQLLSAGAKVDAASEHGDRPLHLASEAGELGLVKLLLEHGANPNVRTRNPDAEGCTPLHLAAGGGHGSVITALLAAGADASSEARSWTAEKFARSAGHVALANRLARQKS